MTRADELRTTRHDELRAAVSIVMDEITPTLTQLLARPNTGGDMFVAESVKTLNVMRDYRKEAWLAGYARYGNISNADRALQEFDRRFPT